MSISREGSEPSPLTCALSLSLSLSIYLSTSPFLSLVFEPRLEARTELRALLAASRLYEARGTLPPAIHGFITLTLTPRTVWMASSTRAKFPLPRGRSVRYFATRIKDLLAAGATTPFSDALASVIASRRENPRGGRSVAVLAVSLLKIPPSIIATNGPPRDERCG